MEILRKKHEADDMSVVIDFEQIIADLPDTDESLHLVQQIWTQYPSASWSRISGFVVEDLVEDKKYKILQLFWSHNKFRMGGRIAAEQYCHKYQ
jgi:hypothetical protein